MTFECRNITLNKNKNDHLTMLLIIVVVLFYSYHQNEVPEVLPAAVEKHC